MIFLILAINNNLFITIEKRYELFSLIKYRFICVDKKNVAKSILIKTRNVPFSKFTIHLRITMNVMLFDGILKVTFLN
jgi:hypothetical protein